MPLAALLGFLFFFVCPVVALSPGVSLPLFFFFLFFSSFSETKIAAEEEEKLVKQVGGGGEGKKRVAVILRERVRYKQSDGEPVREGRGCACFPCSR